MSAAAAVLDPKLATTLKARCALLGVALQMADDDRGRPLFVVSKWAMTRQLESVEQLEAWIKRAGGPSA